MSYTALYRKYPPAEIQDQKRGTGLLSVPHEQTGCPEIKNRYSSITAKD